MLDKLKLIDKRYQDINELLQSNEVIKDVKKMTSLLKELRSIEKTVSLYHELEATMVNINELKALIKSDEEEIVELAKLELDSALEKEEALLEELKILLIPKDPLDEKNVIMEIRGAAGGDEANIFAGDLFRMYTKFAESKGFKIEVMNAIEADVGGFTQIEFMVTGNNVYSVLKYESGAHRVQRVPQTETIGRIHTSTATVLVMPEAEDVDFELNMEEVRIDIFCASGPGGQGVNTTKSAIRVTHIPTNTVVSCQDGRSQHDNKANALKVLQARLYDKMMQEKALKEGEERLSKAGHGDRSEKIRTYNYPQNRVTDHRIGFTIQQLDRVMEGKLDSIVDALIDNDQKSKLTSNETA